MTATTKTGYLFFIFTLLLVACGNDKKSTNVIQNYGPSNLPTPIRVQSNAIGQETTLPANLEVESTAVDYQLTTLPTQIESRSTIPGLEATNTISPTKLQATPVVIQATPSKIVTSSATSTSEPPLIIPTGPLHYAFNTQGGVSELIGLGFNLFDINGSKTNPSNTIELVNALPDGTRALVWLGNLGNGHIGESCPPPGFSDSEFMAVVDALANNPKVFGYNLADEPHPSACPDAANAIKARSDYIHSHAPGQKVYITVQDGTNMCPDGEGCEYAAFRPEISHVDLIGLDPYPCHYDDFGKPVACDFSKITRRVQLAVTNGIPKSIIIPVFQAFGQEGRLDGGSIYYRTPTTSEFQAILDVWESLVPNPVFDISYTWGIQCTESSCVAPQSLKNHPELQKLIKQHNSALPGSEY